MLVVGFGRMGRAGCRLHRRMACLLEDYGDCGVRFGESREVGDGFGGDVKLENGI